MQLYRAIIDITVYTCTSVNGAQHAIVAMHDSYVRIQSHNKDILLNHVVIILLHIMQDVLKSLVTQLSCSEDGDNYCKN